MATAFIAAQLRNPSGDFSDPNDSPNNDALSQTNISERMTQDGTVVLSPRTKRHAACDECRQRKLKCSGEPTGCTRCIRQNLMCTYSVQKQMGRPKKRQKLDEEKQADSNVTSFLEDTSMPPIDPSLSSAIHERTNFENICNAPITQAVKRATQPLTHDSRSTSSTSPYNVPKTPPDDFMKVPYPTDVALWPDFSDMATLPAPIQDSYAKDESHSFDPDANPLSLQNLPATPDCPCLPNLYLTLSTLSTLSAFPVASHTIDTLEAAHRTARSVIYCPVCPQKYQSGSQNVMLSGTLLTVLVDQWQRVIKASAEDLRKGFGMVNDSQRPLSVFEDLEWRTFAYNLVRANVFGDKAVPSIPYSNNRFNSNISISESSTTSRPMTLNGLAEALERRQRQWHGMDPQTDEFPRQLTSDLARGHTSGMTLEDMKSYESEVKEHLCLQIVGHAKLCIRSLNKPTPSVG